MSRREVLDPVPALGPEAVALLALGRLLPERNVTELRDAAAIPGTATRRAFLHVGHAPCATAALVGEGRCCARGTTLVAACRGWRERAT